MSARAIAVNKEFIGQLEELAIEAGKAILAIKAQGFEVENKSDQSPVTIADRSAEDLIVAGLEKLFPDIPIVAEERVHEGNIPNLSANDSFFLVDALDGTKEFVSGLGAYTVNIGYIVNQAPAAGVVFTPEQRRLFSGGNGRAEAYELDGDFKGVERSKIFCRFFEKYQRIVASRSHSSPQTEDYIKAHPDSETLAVGSSLKFCLLAEGLADIYPRFSPTMEWDTAAGDAILRAAGGLTVTDDGAPLYYGKFGRKGIKDFLNPNFIAKATNKPDLE